MTKAEPGLITQHISSSFVPTKAIKKIAGGLLERIGVDLKIPGLLFIDSPGHEAFTTLRKRGGAIADIAILVIDINEGFKPQTEESLNFLRQFRTPFVVALTKIDRIGGWNPKKDSPFIPSFRSQPQRTQDYFEAKLYTVVGQLIGKGFVAERYDRVSDYSKQVAIIPVSGITGEGIQDLLMSLAGIAQKYLTKGLEITPGEGKATVLEVKEFKGLGTTIDIILYDGEIHSGDYIAIGGNTLVTTKVKALLEPNQLQDIRVEKNFRSIKSVTAAAGLKISAPGLEGVIAGSPLRAVSSKSDLARAESEVEKEIEEVEIKTDNEGFVLKADSLGSLEALVKTFKETGIPIRKALVGDVTRTDINEVRALEDRIVFAFGVKVPQDIENLARDNRVEIFSSRIIYSLIDDYKKWEGDRKKRAEERMLDTVTRPGRVKVLPGYVFRQTRPAVFGVEVLAGIIKPGCRLQAKGKIVGEVKEVQSDGNSVAEAKRGAKVALSVQDVVIGKDFKEGDVLDVFLTKRSLETLAKIKNKLSTDELELLGWK